MVGRNEREDISYTQRNIKERNLQGLYAERYSLLLQSKQILANTEILIAEDILVTKKNCHEKKKCSIITKRSFKYGDNGRKY